MLKDDGTLIINIERHTEIPELVGEEVRGSVRRFSKSPETLDPQTTWRMGGETRLYTAWFG